MAAKENIWGLLEKGIAGTAEPEWQPPAWRYQWKSHYRCQLLVHELRTGSSALNRQNDQKAHV
jgi:hypothetical protein